MKVVLASISFYTSYTSQTWFLALGYLHANAISDEVVGPRTDMVHRYYDSSSRSPDQIAEAIAKEKPELVAFSCYVWNTPDIFKVSKKLKELIPDVKILTGGPEVSYHHLKIMKEHEYIDWIGVGEGEETFRELMLALVTDNEQDIPNIAGLCQRKDGKAHLPAPRPYEKNLDRYPSPYLTGVLDVCDLRGGVSYQTARGCPFVCTYCDYGRNQPYFEFSMERVKKEFEYFKKNDAKVLLNVDPTFNYSRQRAEAILNLGIDLKMDAAQWFEAFPTLINQDLIDLVDKSHLCFIGCGIQSCNPKTMRNIRRVWRPEKIAPLLDKIKYRRNVLLSYEIIMGLPGDGLEDYKNTLSWAYDREPADIKSFNLAILPRTPLEKEVEKWNIKYDPDIGHEILSTDFMTAQDVLVGKAINNWHRLMQHLFFRLKRIITKPAGQLIEDWGYHVYHAGYHENINDLLAHRFSPELIDRLADLWEVFVAKECAEQGITDVSKPFKDLLRYHFNRRVRTWVGAFFGDVRDIYFNEPFPELHRYFSVTQKDLPKANGVAKEVPNLGGRVDRDAFNYDMNDLFPHLDADSMAAVPEKQNEYVFFMTPDTGAGCGIVVDKLAKGFLELVNGQSTVAQIGEALGKELGAEAAELAPRIYQALKDTGIFTAPDFMTDQEKGEVSWQSSFPEAFRQLH